MTDTSKAHSNQITYRICPCGFTYDQGLLGNMRHAEECEEARKEFYESHAKEKNSMEYVIHISTKQWEQWKFEREWLRKQEFGEE